jgi:CIC family chloride channel protein
VTAPAPVAPESGPRSTLGRLGWRDPNTVFFALALLVGLLGALGAVLFRSLTHLLTELFTGSADVVEGSRSLPAFWTIALPAAGGLFGGWIARRFVRIYGTMGIAQIMEVVAVGRRTVRFRQSLARTFSSLLVIATGGSEGREGPIIQMAAASASAVARGVKVSPERAQILVACGMAAGVAGAYNTPISATLFVMELIVGSFSMAIFGPVVVSAAVSSVATRAVLGDAPLYRVEPFHITSAIEFLPYVPLGLLAGVGAVFLMRALRLAKRAFHATGWRDEFRMCLAGAGVGIIGLKFPEVWGNGFEGTNLVLGGTVAVGTIGILCVAKITATSLTIGSGGVGGVFTPALMVGATLGCLVGAGMQAVFPHLSAPVYCYGLLGMGGLLAATTRAPILAVIMMFELTDAPAIVLPMMIVSGVAIAGARLFERESIYVEELREAGVHWQGTPQGTALSTLRAGDVMQTGIPLVPQALALEPMVEAFLQTRNTVLFVGDDDGKLLGVVDLHDLKDIMRGGDLSVPIIARDVVRQVPFVTRDASLADVNMKIWLHDYEQLPVVDTVDAQRFLGVVTRRDILGAVDREILGRSALFARVSRLAQGAQEIDYFEMPEQHRMASIDVPPALEGRALSESRLREDHGVSVLAVCRLRPDGTVHRFVPTPAEILRRGDHLIVLATEKGLKDLGVTPA